MMSVDFYRKKMASDFFVISSSRNIKGYETDHIFSEKQSQIGIDNMVGGGGMWSHLTTGGTTNILSQLFFCVLTVIMKQTRRNGKSCALYIGSIIFCFSTFLLTIAITVIKRIKNSKGFCCYQTH